MLVKLKELCEIKSSKRIFENEYVDRGIPFIRGQEVSNKTIFTNSSYNCYISETRYNELKKNYGVPKKGDILITAVGTIGNLCYVDTDFKFYYKDGNLLQFTNFRKDINSRYLYYFMHSDYFQKQLNNNLIGAVQKALTMSMLSEINVPLIDINSQNKIVEILTSIDNQITYNNILINKLQVLAQSIYSSWFIQFNFPNKEGKAYKFSGGKMVYNDEIKREIPEGWEVKKLKDLMFKINRPFDYYNNEKTIDLSVMPSNSFCLVDVNSSKNFSTNLFSMKKGDLLFGSIRPYLKKAGLAPCDGAVAGTVHCLNVYNEFDYNFCLLTLCSENMFNYANKASKGTKMPVISCDDLLEYPIVYNKEIIQKFQILNLKEFIPHLIDEIHKLTSLKNILLPILINGQLQ